MKITRQDVENEIARLRGFIDAKVGDAIELIKLNARIARLEAFMKHMFGSKEPEPIKPPDDGEMYSPYLPPNGGFVKAKKREEP
jgi:hypothetical protein